MTLTDVVPRCLDMETVNTFQHRPVHRCNFQPLPDCVRVDVGRKSHHLYQVEQKREQSHPCEPPLLPPPERGLAIQQLVDVAKGLDYLHQSDVVHGDLKGVSPLPSKNFCLAYRCL